MQLREDQRGLCVAQRGRLVQKRQGFTAVTGYSVSTGVVYRGLLNEAEGALIPSALFEPLDTFFRRVLLASAEGGIREIKVRPRIVLTSRLLEIFKGLVFVLWRTEAISIQQPQVVGCPRVVFVGGDLVVLERRRIVGLTAFEMIITA